MPNMRRIALTACLLVGCQWAEPDGPPPVAPVAPIPPPATPPATPPGASASETEPAAPPAAPVAVHTTAPLPAPLVAPVGEARVRTGVVLVRGGLSSDLVRRVVQRHLPALRACYERGLAQVPRLEGRLVVAFEVDARGTVASARATPASTVVDDDVKSCVVGEVRSWSFPAPAGGTASVEVPLVLSTG